jgi:hypothetical protein
MLGMNLRGRFKLQPVTVLAGGALLVALSGTSYAAVSLPADSVGTAQLKNNTTTSAKVKNGTLLKADFKIGEIPAGQTGPTGPTGPAGPYPTTLPTGKTVVGAYELGGTAAAVGAFA